MVRARGSQKSQSREEVSLSTVIMAPPPRCMLMLVVRACSLSAASCVHMHVEYRAVARAVVWRVELTLDAREL